MKRLVALAVFAEQELLEEPGGMGAVPFRRARIRHRLDLLIFCRQGIGAALGLVSDRQVRFHQILGEASAVAADAGFVTIISVRGKNVTVAARFPANSLS